MADEPLEVLVVRKTPDGTFAAGDALQKLRIVQDGLRVPPSGKFIEDFIWREASSGHASRNNDRQSPIGEAG
jgi:hypothetical protein